MPAVLRPQHIRFGNNILEWVASNPRGRDEQAIERLAAGNAVVKFSVSDANVRNDILMTRLDTIRFAPIVPQGRMIHAAPLAVSQYANTAVPDLWIGARHTAGS